MNRFIWGPRFWFLVSAVIALALDQVSKWLVLRFETLHVSRQVL